jgi:oxygen-independent coproporphyrinogen-3 oxidase
MLARVRQNNNFLFFIFPKKMLKNLLLKYDKQLPRYTSYPTAPHFSSEVNREIYSSWLQNLSPQKTLSLYFHLPFCQQLCWYCGCYTKITKRYEPVEDYTEILLQEIRLVSALLRKKNHKVSHIHFGGGSPTIFLPDSFENLMRVIRNEFSIAENAEIAIEVDPRNVGEEKISAYAKSGVNRVSIGVQDFNREVQIAVNREQSFDLVYSCVKLFKKYGIKNVNLDLIYGLPKQTVAGIAKNIDLAMLLNPNRIALFAYAHVQWMKKHMRLIDEKDLPNGASRIEMYLAAAKKLRKAGYVSIGLDHFAKQSDSMVAAFRSKKLKRNFQGYSSDKADSVIGFGASAISFLPNGYAQNILDFAEYKKNILAKKLPVLKGIKISAEDRLRKKIIDEVMCYLEVDLMQIREQFDLPENYFENEIKNLEELKKDRLISIQNGVVKINPEVPQITRIVCSIFDKFFSADQKRHSRI